MKQFAVVRPLLLRVVCGIAALAFLATATAYDSPGKGVQVVADETNRRVDITIDGKPFTSYIWPATLKKPVLYPMVDADGVTVTRGWPLQPRPGERTDHPHHDGLWFNYSNVNGLDFWNNSEAIPAARSAKMGTIVFDKIVSAKSGRDRGELTTDSTWVDGLSHPILAETTRYIFARYGDERSIDLIARLTALGRVVFNDDKDGLLGLRVARWLESPEEKGGTFTDGNGVATTVAAAASMPGVAPPTGEYLTSEGVKGEAAWSTRGRWCALTGHDDAGHTVTIAIFDHPGNVNYPTYWHARGYGLFAANPLGQHMFDPKQPPLNYALEKGQSATFRYRIAIYAHAATVDELNHEGDAFAAESD
jgi:Methane oxygenase PmoA